MKWSSAINLTKFSTAKPTCKQEPLRPKASPRSSISSLGDLATDEDGVTRPYRSSCDTNDEHSLPSLYRGRPYHRSPLDNQSRLYTRRKSTPRAIYPRPMSWSSFDPQDEPDSHLAKYIFEPSTIERTRTGKSLSEQVHLSTSDIERDLHSVMSGGAGQLIAPHFLRAADLSQATAPLVVTNLLPVYFFKQLLALLGPASCEAARLSCKSWAVGFDLALMANAPILCTDPAERVLQRHESITGLERDNVNKL